MTSEVAHSHPRDYGGACLIATIAQAHDNSNLKPDGRPETTGDVGDARMRTVGPPKLKAPRFVLAAAIIGKHESDTHAGEVTMSSPKETKRVRLDDTRRSIGALPSTTRPSTSSARRAFRN